MKHNNTLAAITSFSEPRTLFGKPVQQSFISFGVYEQAIGAAPRPLRWICELGTGNGITTLFLALHAFYQDIPFVTFDKHALYGQQTRRLLKACHARVIHEDCFSARGRELFAALVPSAPGLLFCDNGDKRKEIRTFIPMIGPHSIVVVHDWGNEIGESDIPWDKVVAFNPWHEDSIALGTHAAILRVMGLREQRDCRRKERGD